jgi:hypothetical protein
MKNKAVIFSIGVFLLLVFTGAYFVYSAIFTESVSGLNDERTHDKSDSLARVGSAGSAEATGGQGASDPNKREAINKGSSSSVGRNTVSGKRSNGKGNSESVVDQTLHSLNIKDENGNVISNVLGSVKEKIDIHVTLYDGEQSKVLSNYDVEFKSKYNNDSVKGNNFKTDKDGKFIYTTTQTGFLYLQIFTKDFSIHSKYLVVRYGKNEYKAKLYKGGTLEVKATNINNKVVEGLTAKLGNGFRNRQAQDSIPLELDAARGIYFLPNIPVGTQDISFKATGYTETPQYKVLVETKNVATLDLKLQTARVLYFDLEIKTKPDLIYVANRKYARGRGRNVVQHEVYGRGINEVASANSTTIPIESQIGALRSNESAGGINRGNDAQGQGGGLGRQGGARGNQNPNRAQQSFFSNNIDKSEVFKNF